MTLGWFRHLDAQFRCFLPAITAVLALLIDQIPIPGEGVGRTGPLALLCVVTFWSIYRPDLLPVPAVFAAGFVTDALAGLPLGLTSLTLILIRMVVVGQQRFFVARSFPVVWACFGVMATAAILFRWLLMSIWAGHVFRFTPSLFELLATFVAYPLVSLALGWIHNRVPRFIYAP